MMLHTLRMIGKLKRSACTEDNTQSKTNAFPDGESILVIEHNIGKFDVNSFPEGSGAAAVRRLFLKDRVPLSSFPGRLSHPVCVMPKSNSPPIAWM